MGATIAARVTSKGSERNAQAALQAAREAAVRDAMKEDAARAERFIHEALRLATDPKATPGQREAARVILKNLSQQVGLPSDMAVMAGSLVYLTAGNQLESAGVAFAMGEEVVFYVDVAEDQDDHGAEEV